jgi:hypothetical protein
VATHTKPEGKVKSFGQNIESDLASRFLRVVETAAIASAHTMGQGERKLSDQVTRGQTGRFLLSADLPLTSQLEWCSDTQSNFQRQRRRTGVSAPHGIGARCPVGEN